MNDKSPSPQPLPGAPKTFPRWEPIIPTVGTHHSHGGNVFGPPTHPLERFHFCPSCGSPCFTPNNFKSKHCDHCGFTYYANASSATAAFIRNSRGELLVAVRGKEPAKDTLDLPGGFVDMEETAEQGIIREVREETGLTVTRPRYLFSIPNRYLYSGMVIHTLDMFFEIVVDNNANPRADDDAADLSWMPLERVDPALFGLYSISLGVKQYLSQHSEIPLPNPNYS